jgi:hypothetical protein
VVIEPTGARYSEMATAMRLIAAKAASTDVREELLVLAAQFEQLAHYVAVLASHQSIIPEQIALASASGGAVSSVQPPE